MRLRVLCCCGARITEVAPTSSLLGLARLVHAENGTMTIDDAGDGSHVFQLTWPSSSRPRARAVTVGTLARGDDPPDARAGAKEALDA